MSAVIRVKDLTRKYGELTAVSALTFDVQQGEVVGFVGANGAGKTTTMRIMATLEMPTAGGVEICGHDVVNHPDEVRRQDRMDARCVWTLRVYDGLRISRFLCPGVRLFG